MGAPPHGMDHKSSLSMAKFKVIIIAYELNAHLSIRGWENAFSPRKY